MAIRSIEVPDVRSLIADVVGADELRIGHRIRYRDNAQKREYWLSACWDMTFMPTFSAHGTVAAVSTSVLDDDGKSTQSRIHAVLCSNRHSHLITIEQDPVIGLVTSLPLLSPPDFRQSRDGIGFQFHLTTTDLDLALKFDNPELIELRSIQDGCFQLAESIAQASDNSQLRQFVIELSRYIKH